MNPYDKLLARIQAMTEAAERRSGKTADRKAADGVQTPHPPTAHHAPKPHAKKKAHRPKHRRAHRR